MPAPAPAAVTFAHRWRQAVAAAGTRPFLRFEDAEGRVTEWTYGAFDDVVRRVAGALRDDGVEPGSAVHLALANSPTFVAVWLACARLGAWMVPSDPRASAAELAGHLGRTRPEVGVCAADRAGVYRQAVTDAREATGGATPAIWEIDEADVGFDRVSASPIADGEVPEPAIGDRLAVMFTSGTTSAPKGVELTQANYAFAGDVMALAAGLGPRDRQLVVLPLFHANAQYYSFASAIAVGASVALVHAFSASRFLEQAARHAATHASLFAAPMRMILARGATAVPGLALRHVWYAQNVTDAQYAELSALLGCRPRQLYGMTETLPAVLTDRALDPVPSAMGFPSPGCHVEVRRSDAPGERAAPGEVGDLAVGGWPGHTLFAGYLDDPDTTERAVLGRHEDGYVWFATGDRARADAEGRFYFEGRSGDVLKVAGENVSTVEVEAALAEHPGVLEAAVVGEPDPVRDEVPVAFVVLRPGDGVTDVDALANWCAERLSPSKRPREIHVVEELPRTSVGKIRKFLLSRPDPVRR